MLFALLELFVYCVKLGFVHDYDVTFKTLVTVSVSAFNKHVDVDVVILCEILQTIALFVVFCLDFVQCFFIHGCHLSGFMNESWTLQFWCCIFCRSSDINLSRFMNLCRWVHERCRGSNLHLQTGAKKGRILHLKKSNCKWALNCFISQKEKAPEKRLKFLCLHIAWKVHYFDSMLSRYSLN